MAVVNAVLVVCGNRADSDGNGVSYSDGGGW